MSKEYVRQLVTSRFNSFIFGTEFGADTRYANEAERSDSRQFAKFILDGSRKSYPNRPNQPTPTSGRWIRLHDIEFVLHKIASIGSEPCTRRTGVIVIDAFERLDMGTKKIFELTDALEAWFFPWSEGSLWTSPANTVNYPDKGDKDGYYQSTVYVPFTYDED